MRKLYRTGKWLLDFYLFGNIHIALCALALALVTRDLFGLHIRHELLVFIFCGTFFGYNVQRIPAAFANAHIARKFIRHSWYTVHRKLLAGTSVIAALAALWAFSQLYLRSQLLSLVPAFLSVAYAFPLIPGKGRWVGLREIPAAKIFIIAIVWMMSCAMMPAAAAGHPGEKWLTVPVALWSLTSALLIFALTVPFDIRDLHYDGEKLKTLPSMLGVKRSVWVAIGALAVSLGLVIVIRTVYSTGTNAQVGMYAGWCVITSYVIAKSSPERHEYFFSLLIDGLILLLWGMIWLAEFF
jgi:hypothetical protein